MKWKPMHTAPKDATTILLLVDGNAIEGFRNMDYDAEDGYSRQWSTISLDSHGCGCCGSEDDPPTHWMKLPEKPEEMDV